MQIARVRGLLERQRPRDAVAAAEDALERFPSNAQLRFLYGVALSDAGRPDDAIASFEALVRDHPELAEPYNNLAVLHASQGRLTAARDALEKAVQAVPDYGLAYENLGDLYLRLAREAYERATTVAKPSTDARRKLTLVRSLAEQMQR
ncbi:MAG: tetratricopeptide repeat protein [Burkholderiaceae bacterium]